jgi:hypothetical protein
MAELLTKEDIDHLTKLVGESYEEGVNNRDTYYSYLEERGYQYGGLAGGVVREDSLSGRIANAFMAETAAQSGNAINLSTSLKISYDLMKADLKARADEVKEFGSVGELKAETHYENHKDVFSKKEYGLGIENWTAAEPIEYYIDNYETLGFDTATQAANTILDYMMSLDTVGEFTQFQFAVGAMIDFPDATLLSRAELAKWQLISQSVALEHLGYITTGQGTPYQQPKHCFLGDTLIQMWPCDLALKPRTDGTYDEPFVLSHVWRKPIREIKIGDVVVCYDERGNLHPSPVTSTMKSLASHILDFWGTGVTPGHAYFCADGKFKDKHVPLMDILRSDGAIMRADGTKVRAATNCKLGSMGDMMIHVGATKELPDGTWTEPKSGMARFGTRIILPDGRHRSFMEMAAEEGWKVTENGYMFGRVKLEDGRVVEHSFKFPYVHGTEVPKPEDYILARSAVTLQEIYAAGEWEQIGTELPAPAGMEGLNPNHKSPLLMRSKPRPNIPPAFANRPDAPVAQTQRAARPSMNRKQRKAMEAKERKAGKLRKRLVH